MTRRLHRFEWKVAMLEMCDRLSITEHQFGELSALFVMEFIAYHGGKGDRRRSGVASSPAPSGEYATSYAEARAKGWI